jgi:hypothetical protein
VIAVPEASPTGPPNAVACGAPNAEVFVVCPVLKVLPVLPNRPPELVFVAPNAGLLNKPPDAFPDPNAGVVLLVWVPNPLPNPELVEAAGVLLPKRPPPDAPPKAGLAVLPNGVEVEAPNVVPVGERCVSVGLRESELLRRRSTFTSESEAIEIDQGQRAEETVRLERVFSHSRRPRR